MKYIVLLCIALPLFASCTNKAQPDATGDKSPQIMPDAQNDDAAYQLIGLSEQEARIKAREMRKPFRVVMRDKKILAVTMDLRPGRINATVENDIVTAIKIEKGASIKIDVN